MGGNPCIFISVLVACFNMHNLRQLISTEKKERINNEAIN